MRRLALAAALLLAFKPAHAVKTVMEGIYASNNTVLIDTTNARVYEDLLSTGPAGIDVRGYTTLAAAVTAIGTVSTTTLIISTVCTVNTNVTVGKNITLKFVGPGMLNVAAGKTVSIIQTPDAGWHQIFQGAGSVSFSGSYDTVQDVKVAWWGAHGDNLTTGVDNDVAIASATASLPTANSFGTLEFQPGGRYMLPNTLIPPIHFDRSMTVKGNGAILTQVGASTAIVIGPLLGVGSGSFSTFEIDDLVINSSGDYTGTCILQNAVNGVTTRNISCSGFYYGLFYYSDAGSGGEGSVNFNYVSEDNLIATVFDSTQSLVASSSVNGVKFYGGNFVTAHNFVSGSRNVLVRNGNKGHLPDGLAFEGVIPQAQTEIKFEIQEGKFECHDCYYDQGGGLGQDIVLGTASYQCLFVGGDGLELQAVQDYGTDNAVLDTKNHLSALKYVTTSPTAAVQISTTSSVLLELYRTGAAGGGLRIGGDVTHYGQVSYGYSANNVQIGPIGQTTALVVDKDGNTDINALNAGTATFTTANSLIAGFYRTGSSGGSIRIGGDTTHHVAIDYIFSTNKACMGVFGNTDAICTDGAGGTIANGTMTVVGPQLSVGGSSFTVSGGSATVAYSLTAGSFVGNATTATNLASAPNTTNTGTLNLIGLGDTSSTECVSGSTITMTVQNANNMVLVSFAGFLRSNQTGDQLQLSVLVDGKRQYYETAGTGFVSANETDTSNATKNMSFPMIVTGLTAASHNFCLSAWHSGAGAFDILRGVMMVNEIR